MKEPLPVGIDDFGIKGGKRVWENGEWLPESSGTNRNAMLCYAMEPEKEG